jgi:peptidoglycan/xylan/chitin deacetylase (PgdA/CDA1 family)
MELSKKNSQLHFSRPKWSNATFLFFHFKHPFNMNNGIASRNLIGYGENTPDPKWPNNAKIAVSFVLNYEEGGENTVLNNDKFSETFLSETPNGTPRQVRDINTETQYEYGSRVGVWRIIRLFKKFNFHFTCYAVGLAVEKNPEAIKKMEMDGHEIASHNYKWVDYQGLNDETERLYIRKTIDAIKNNTIKKRAPVGWYTGRISDKSREILYSEYKNLGLELLYENDAYNDDLPYWVEMENKGYLVIPYTLDQNDMKFAVSTGFSGPDQFFEYLKNAFDCLLEEGREGSPKMMTIGLHCRLIGKPGRIQALKKFMEYVKLHEDAWVATREEIALHWRSVHPFKK